MYRSLNRIWAVALLTGTEGLRQPVFFFLFAAAAVLTATSPYFALFHLNEEGKMVIDLGISTILTFSTLLALLTASSTVTDEIDGRTALTMLSKPLRREEFLLGKYLGIAATTAALILLMAPVLLATFRSQHYQPEQDPHFGRGVQLGLILALGLYGAAMVLRLLFGRNTSLIKAFWVSYAIATAVMLVYPALAGKGNAVWEWRLFTGLLFIALHGCVISAMAIALATRFTLVQAAIGTAAFFVVGHASGALVAPFRDTNQQLNAFGRVLRTVLPDLDQYNLTDALATAYLELPTAIPWDVIAGSAAYALLYGLALLAVASALFTRRELG